MSPSEPAVLSVPVRDSRIDTLRGLFLVIMTIDHIAPPWITRYSSEPIGFVSAMEGFFLVSGYTYALVHRRLLATSVLLWQRTLKRVRALVVYHLSGLALVFLLAVLGVFHAGAWLERARDLHALGTASLVLWSGLLIYRPQFFDVLPSYVLMMLAAPWWLRALSTPSGSRQLLFGSALLWALAQIWDPVSWFAKTFSPVVSVWPNVLAWQAIFILGMWLVGRSPRWALGSAMSAVCGLLACIFFAMRHELMEVEPALHVFLSKHSVGALRFLNLLVAVQLMVVALASVPKTARIRWLAFLGSHSLEVFSFHVLLAYAATAFAFESKAASVLLVATCVGLLTVPAWLHQRLTRPR